MGGARLGCLVILGFLGALLLLGGVTAYFGERGGSAPKAAESADQKKAVTDVASPEMNAPRVVPSADAPPGWKPSDSVAPLPPSGGGYADMDRLTTDAVLLGRGIGCGITVSRQSGRVGAWLDKVAPPGSDNHQLMLNVLMAGMAQNAQAQVSGSSPDGCGEVAEAIQGHRWP